MYLIYRSPNQGLDGKTAWHLPQPTVLSWVRSVWQEASDSPNTYDWLVQRLGTHIYGLHWLFEGGPAPRTMQELRTLAMERLPDTLQCNADERSLRVLANGLDDEVAYYLVDDAAVAAEPGRWSFVVHEGPLPGDVEPSGSGPTFTPPVTVTDLAPASPATGEELTYTVLLTCKAKHDSVGWDPTYVVRGARPARLGAALRDLDTATDDWPVELGVLRALVAPEEEGIAAALRRCNHWPDYAEPSQRSLAQLDSHSSAMRFLDAVSPPPRYHRERTVIRMGEHLAQMAIGNGRDSFEQWLFFDDLWARTHPDLAASLMWYAYHWDPLCSRHHFKLTPCSDNRVLYLAVADEDGALHVRPAEPHDEPRVWDLRRWSYERRPAGDLTAGEVAGEVEIQLHQSDSAGCRFTAFEITRTRYGQTVAAMLARHIRAELRAAGITRATDWLPDNRPHGKLFLRVLGTIHKPPHEPSTLHIT
ncbi:hypothetical protein [Nonomuraea sp. NPDC048916]|uniref:hypothetical protein n=1 Tax=Nonomuraea sp. NPDC048916 TaxID=3154232 RepID=UPI0033C78F1F